MKAQNNPHNRAIRYADGYRFITFRSGSDRIESAHKTYANALRKARRDRLQIATLIDK